MSFWNKASNKKTKCKKNYYINQENPNPLLTKGASADISFKGSLTVETAIVLPIFLFAFFTLIYIGDVIRQSADMQEKLMQRAMKLSTYAYCSGGSALLGKNQVIDLTKRQRVDIPFAPAGVDGIQIIDRARVRAFTGYDNTINETSGKTLDTVVYVTDYGSVYHKSIGCRHLELSIRAVSMTEAGSARNAGGHKYYACEHCAKKGAPHKVYVTDYGDRYHKDRHCMGLKRGIHSMYLSEAGGLPPCSDCGR